MAATVTINRPDLFPVGTSVSAYPLRRVAAEPTAGIQPSTAAAATATVAGTGMVTFTGLADGTSFQAAAQVNGTWRHVLFTTAPPAKVWQSGTTKPAWKTRREALGLL